MLKNNNGYFILKDFLFFEKNIYEKTLPFLFVFVVLNTQAQFQKNDHLLTGLINLSTNKVEYLPSGGNNNSNFGVGINISASRFVSAKAFNSLSLTFNHNVSKRIPAVNTEDKQVTNTGGLTFSHTLLTPLAQRVYLSFPLSIGASASRSQYKTNDQLTARSNSFTVGASATIGVMYLTKKNWVFTANMGSLAGIRFDHSKLNPVSTTATSSKSNSLNIYGGAIGTAFNNLSIGIGYMIR